LGLSPVMADIKDAEAAPTGEPVLRLCPICGNHWTSRFKFGEGIRCSIDHGGCGATFKVIKVRDE